MKRFDCRTLALFSALLLQISAALAQNNEDEEVLALAYGDKATISIATGSRQALRRAPAVASVVTAEEIAAMGATDLDEVLEGIPGMHVSRTAYYAPVYGIRGIQSSPTDSRTLMLQNGVPMTTLYLGDKGHNWGGLPLENVARIEIVRGPGSALYGADAYAGVINIITKSAADTPGTEFGVRIGSFNTRDSWVQHGGQAGPLEVAAYLRIGSTDGINGIIAADAQSARDRIFGSNASLAPGPVHTGHDDIDGALDLGYGKWRLRAGYKLRDRLGVGAGIASTLDPLGQNRSERVTTDLSWADPFLAKDWGAGFTASYLHYAETLAANYQLSPPGTVFPTGVFPSGMIGDPDRFERQLRLSTFATYVGIHGHSLRFGLGHDDLNMYETGTHKNYLLNASGVPVPTGPVIDYSGIQPHLRPQRRKLDYFYVQDEWQFARDWALTAGLRHDRFSDFGGTTNPRLALVWDAAQQLTAKLLYGQAFRAPSFNEQYGINPVANGNPNLKPETIRTLEAAFAWQARPDTLVNLSFFRNAMQDIIRAVPNASGSGSTFSNTGLQNGRGMELEAVWDASRSLRLTGNYSWQRSIDETTGTDAGYAPHHHLYVRADWRFTGNWLASTQINRVAERKRAAGDLRSDVPDYTTIDLTLRTTNSKNRWNFAGSVRNLFNADVREPSLAPGTAIPNDLPMAPRTAYVQAIYKL
ncbi:MAG: TonB-dependent receptor [Rhodocyclaceae bacterium]